MVLIQHPDIHRIVRVAEPEWLLYMREPKMKVARNIFLGVVVGVLVLAIFLTRLTQAASQVSPKTPINSLSASTSVHEKVVNADSIVYWRSDPDWNTPLTMTQQGVYTGDTVALACYTRGSTVPPNNNNPLWYWAEVVSGQGQGSGWVNDHFLNTGTNQPDIPVNDVNPCPKDPYVWSNSGIAYVRAQPEDSMYYEPVLYNSYPLALMNCWVDGGWAEGDYWTNRWFYLPVPEDNIGTWGYINASVVANRHTLPQCNSDIQTPTVTLAQGPVYSGNVYRYAITLSGFPANASVSVECYDSVSPNGFLHFTITTDGSGNASTQSECYSGDGPDHWVVAGGVTSNHVQWGGRSPTPQPPTPTNTPTNTPTPTPTSAPPPGPTVTPTPTPVKTYAEQEGSHGANTFTDPYNASGMGPKIPAAAWVQVVCKVYAPQIQSANPDGYWYLIATSPWNSAYYAVANTFMNGDPWGGPYTHNTDFNVPDC